MNECKACHLTDAAAGPPFLGDSVADADATYLALTRWPGVIALDPASSTLLVASQSSTHPGPTPTPPLVDALTAWLDAEAEERFGAGDAHLTCETEAFDVTPGHNVVELGSLGLPFRDITLAFDVAEPTKTLLLLSDLLVAAAPKAGIALDHPLFVLHRPNSGEGIPDPADGLSDVSVTVPPGESASIGPSFVVLTGWKEGTRLSIAFKAVAPVSDRLPPQRN